MVALSVVWALACEALFRSATGMGRANVWTDGSWEHTGIGRIRCRCRALTRSAQLSLVVCHNVWAPSYVPSTG